MTEQKLKRGKPFTLINRARSDLRSPSRVILIANPFFIETERKVFLQSEASK